MSRLPLKFRDSKRYTDRLKESRARTGLDDALVVLTDSTTGNVSASFAMLGDIHIAEPGALIDVPGVRIIGQLPPSSLLALAAPPPEPAELAAA